MYYINILDFVTWTISKCKQNNFLEYILHNKFYSNSNSSLRDTKSCILDGKDEVNEEDNPSDDSEDTHSDTSGATSIWK